MKIYTKTGDRGETSLFGGGRVRKDDPRVAAYGEVDELNSHVGLLVTYIREAGYLRDAAERQKVLQTLTNLQNRLFDLGAELATGKSEFLTKLPRLIAESDVHDLEQAIDAMETGLSPLKNFILPGGNLAAAQAHVCRSTARRAERAMISTEESSVLLITYMNRVSDFFFIVARHLNRLSGTAEPEWEK